MNYTKTGQCPKCGAAIWSPIVWKELTPPPSHYSCNCSLDIIGNDNKKSSTTNIIDELKKEILDLKAQVAKVKEDLGKILQKEDSDKPKSRIILKD